jgi:hypothetical protein
MGFNPFRPRRNSTFDAAMVAVAVVVTAALVIWAMIG